MGESIIQRTFAGGELAPVMHARADVAKFLSGLRTCRQFVIHREGGASNRAGFGFVDPAKTDTIGTRFMRFVPSSGNGFLIEMGAGYFRFVRNGALLEVTGVPAYNGATPYVPGDLVISAAVIYYCHTATTGNAPPNVNFWHALTMTSATQGIYEIPTPYALNELPKWKQSDNVITLTNGVATPRELVFESVTRWVLRLVTTASSIAAPGGLAGVAGAAGALSFAYIVTTAALETYEESIGSAPFTIVGCAEPTAALPNALTWTAVAGSAEYYVYCDPYGNGVYGFVGTSATNAFKDAGFVPDFNQTPPIVRNLFNAANNYPRVSVNFQQRRFFCNTTADPDGIFGSRTGFPANFGISSPLQDDDAVTFRLAGNNQGAIHHAEALAAGLILMTNGGEWTMTGGGGAKSPITPSSIDAEQETYVGIDPDVPPVVIGNAIIYVQARGAIVRELRFDQAVEGLAGKDLGIWASHLFKRKTIAAMDYQQNPDSIVWCVLSDGTLVGLTYIPEQEVWGWHRHATYTNLAAGGTQSLIEDVIVIPEDEEDAVYVLVARVIEGVTKRYIERLERRELREDFFATDAFFVDSGISYVGPPANNFSGLDHLEGQVVAVLADGAVVFNGDSTSPNAATYTVVGGELAIPDLASVVHIGLPIQFARLETLDIDVGGGNLRDKKKLVASATLLLDRSSRAFWAGPDASTLRQYIPQGWETNANEATGQFEIAMTATFDKPGRVLVEQKDPLPITIIGIVPNVTVGG